MGRKKGAKNLFLGPFGSRWPREVFLGLRKGTFFGPLLGRTGKGMPLLIRKGRKGAPFGPLRGHGRGRIAERISSGPPKAVQKVVKFWSKFDQNLVTSGGSSGWLEEAPQPNGSGEGDLKGLSEEPLRGQEVTRMTERAASGRPEAGQNGPKI